MICFPLNGFQDHESSHFMGYMSNLRLNVLILQAKLICELNATNAKEMGDLDFDIILNAYDRITTDYFFGVTEDQALVILSHCIYDINSDELILRQSAYKSLLSFVEFSALIIEEGVKDQEVPAQAMAVDDSYWTVNHIQRIVNKFLLKHMEDAMSKGTTMQKVDIC